MRNEEFAYQEGFRVTKDGKLYNLNGRKYKTRIVGTREKFSFRRFQRTFDITIARLQAYQKFGKEMYEFKLVRHTNSNPLDSSYDNIEIGKGSELITPELKRLEKTERAFRLGYSVSGKGNLLLNGIDISDRVFFNTDGYKLFAIPYKKNRMQEVFVHRLVAYCKFGKEIFEHECVRHLNGDCVDNSWDNIELGTFKDNSNDISLEVKAQMYLKSALKHIKYAVPLRNKLRREHLKGERVCDLSRKYDIPYSTVRSIVQNISIV